MIGGSLLGYRAPLLEVNDHTYQVLSESEREFDGKIYKKKYFYDASRVADSSDWPRKDSRGL